MDVYSDEPLSFGQLEVVAAEVNNVAPGDRSALAARLRMLGRLGLPEVPRVGTGRRAAYDFNAVWQTAVAIEMIQLSLSTEWAAKLVLHAWNTSLRGFIPLAAVNGKLVVIVLNLEGYDGLTRLNDPQAIEQARAATSRTGKFVPLAGWGYYEDAFGPDGPYNRLDPDRFKRLSIINATGLFERLMRAFESLDRDAPERFRAWSRAQPATH